MGDMEAMDIMVRGLLMLNLLLLLSLAMDMVMVVMADLAMDMEAMDIMDMEAMDIMDMEAMDIMDTVVMDTTDKEKYRLEFHKQCDAKSSVTSYMKLIYKESSHELIFLYLIINKRYR